MTNLSLYFMGAFYILAGLNHFRDPLFYMKMMPRYIPHHKLLVIVSGIVEIFLGFALFIESVTKYALVGIIILLILIFPANIEMVNSKNFLKIPRWLKLLRLPLQGVLIYWAYFHLN